jgi:FkbM family methyltransferase
MSVTRWSLSPEDVVRVLYRGTLGREPDPPGLSHHVAMLQRGADTRAVLESLATSEESGHDARACVELAELAAAALGRAPVVVDVGAQQLESEEHVYVGLWSFGPVDVFGFDPLAERIEERRRADAGRTGTTTLFPFALGDGDDHVLHVANEDSASSLFDLDREGVAGLEHLAELQVDRTEPVRTVRLDDVELPEQIDLLKLDVQGAEMMVLEGAAQTLQRTSAIHCEVAFSRIYRDQPLFGDVAGLLAGHGYALMDLFPKHYRYTDATRSPSRDRLIWADACFLRRTTDPHTLVSQALIAAAVHSKPNLAEHLLGEAQRVERS